MLCCWVEDPNSEAFKLHLPRIHDYLWLAEDGMKMQVRWHICIYDHAMLIIYMDGSELPIQYHQYYACYINLYEAVNFFS